MKTNVLKTRHGFTLTELLVALTIVVVLTLISIPAIEPMIKTKGVDQAAYIIQGGLQHARYAAVAENKQSLCWLIQGTVFETGPITQSTANGLPGSAPVDIIVDDSTTGQFTKVGSWSFFGGMGYNNTGIWQLPPGDGSATWTFTLVAGTGNLEVLAYWSAYSNRANNIYYKIKTNDGAETTIGPFDQRTESGWKSLGTFAFTGPGTRYVQISLTSSNGYSIADAVRIRNTWTTGCPANTFVDSTKTSWPTDAWKTQYVTWASNQTGRSYTRRISSSDNKGKVVAEPPDWSPYPEINARYVITRDDPTVAPQADLCIGSGTTTAILWNTLPDGSTVCLNRINDDGSESADKTFPIVFTTLGRVLTPNDHTNIKIFDRERPNDRTFWRFMRIYRNTGRVFVARSLSELP